MSDMPGLPATRWDDVVSHVNTYKPAATFILHCPNNHDVELRHDTWHLADTVPCPHCPEDVDVAHARAHSDCHDLDDLPDLLGEDGVEPFLTPEDEAAAEKLIAYWASVMFATWDTDIAPKFEDDEEEGLVL